MPKRHDAESIQESARPMRVSVVINTYNRVRSLARTLESLDYLTHPDFEAIVVNGPSTDETGAVLERHQGRIRVGSCPEINLSKSRNIGIDLAEGEIVAFLDDDAIPEPNWLSDLVAGYDMPMVGGVGGVVYDYTGYTVQYKSGVSDRLGDTRVNLEGPFWAYQVPGSDRYVHLLGTNSSFRRSCLLEIGGFDEEFEYYLDETDLCLRLQDRGYMIRQLPNAFVHHHFLPSHLRNAKRLLNHPFPVVKNKIYFALQNGHPRYSEPAILRQIQTFARHILEQHVPSLDDEQDRANFLAEVERAFETGIRRGCRTTRSFGRFRAKPAEGVAFTRFATRRPDRGRLTLCFLSQEAPPAPSGGIGRFVHDLATTLGSLGHEVHLITKGSERNLVEFDEGAWIHRILPRDLVPAGLETWPGIRRNLGLASAAYDEVCRIAETRPIDIIQVPIWDCEGILCQLDDRFRTVLSLQTTMKTVADLNPSWGDSPDARGLIALEEFALRQAGYIHAISPAILEKVQADYGLAFPPDRVGLIPLGVPDVGGQFRRTAIGDRLRVLFVGRLEKRKGIDLFLAAAARLCAESGQVEFVVVGDDTLQTGRGTTYKEEFLAACGAEVAARVQFLGKVEDDELYQQYANTDIFCAPSRYESFGIVFLEAMMFAKPVVGCAIGGMPSIIEDGVNGFLARPDDVDSLADALRRLIHNGPLRQEMGVRARALFLERFTARRMAREIEDFYRRILEV